MTAYAVRAKAMRFLYSETISSRDADFGLLDFDAPLMDSTPDSNFFFQRLTVS